MGVLRDSLGVPWELLWDSEGLLMDPFWVP